MARNTSSIPPPSQLTRLNSNGGDHPGSGSLEDSLLQAVQARFRKGLYYSYIGSSTLLAFNSFTTLAEDSEVSANGYIQKHRAGRGTSPELDALSPHPYDLATQIYGLALRSRETQAVLYRGLTGSGKSASMSLITSQLLRLSSTYDTETRLSHQVRALETVLQSFGDAKTLLSPSASRYGRFLELHFGPQGGLAAAKVLTFGLDKSRLIKLSHDERTFHVFYQLLAGATPEEKIEFGLLDVASSYDLLASSGCYRLPGVGHLGDDAIAMDDLRASFKTLGFKPKNITSIWRVLSALLLLGNLNFHNTYSGKDSSVESAAVSNHDVLQSVSTLLGIDVEQFEQTLTTRTRSIRHEAVTSILNSNDAQQQRDSITSSIYAILFHYVTETANHRLCPPGSNDTDSTHSSVVQLDFPGFQTLTLDRPGTDGLVRVPDGFENFCFNLGSDLVEGWYARVASSACNSQLQLRGSSGSVPAFKDHSEALDLLVGSGPESVSITRILNAACEAVDAGVKVSREADQECSTRFRQYYHQHPNFVIRSGFSPSTFAINHYAGTATYNLDGFINKNSDAVDADFVALMKASHDSFIARLFCGPGLAVESHPFDNDALVAAQASGLPLRSPSSISTIGGQVTDCVPLVDPTRIYPATTQLTATLEHLLSVMEQCRLWSVISVRPNDMAQHGAFDTRRVRSQLSALQVPTLVSSKPFDFVTQFDVNEFAHRYSLPSSNHIFEFLQSTGLQEGEAFLLKDEKVWLTASGWSMLEVYRPSEALGSTGYSGPFDQSASQLIDYPQPPSKFGESVDNLLTNVARQGNNTPPATTQAPAYYDSGHVTVPSGKGEDQWGNDWNPKGGAPGPISQLPTLSKEAIEPQRQKQGRGVVEEIPASRTRRMWLFIVWAFTWWIPSPLLHHVGRMKREDVRLAWREKFTLCMLIALLCAVVIFYIVAFGRILCPDMNKAWNTKQLGFHQGEKDYWVAVRGEVYDLTKFWRGQHSDIPGQDVTSEDMLTLAGQDLTEYFPVPLTLGCQGLVSDDSLVLKTNSSPTVPTAIHTSGHLQPVQSSKLGNNDWYTQTFLPKMDGYRKGPLVFSHGNIKSKANDGSRQWAIYEGEILDLSDYFYTLDLNPNNDAYKFLDTALTDIWQQQPGSDVTKAVHNVLDAQSNTTAASANLACMRNLFYTGKTDFRNTPRCQVQPYMLLGFTILIAATILAKFIAALQLGMKRTPELRDKFVICQVPCYTESEESLKKTIDSLATLRYDDKRKLLFLICDGMIIGSGNDRPTPRIVLDILGVDPNVNPDSLLFKSVGEGSQQLNYGKVYSGLYEVEGHVVPYIVVSKVGKPSERSRPGNRGKRDSQILVMRFLNRVHFDAEMAPLELEIHHQIKNVIGVDPTLYEYILTVDADTEVMPDSLNRLVACVADDSKIIGLCGETKLSNEQRSWWTMIQVYEYYISHHLTKAFESLFGTVTCLPGCFSLYRVRSVDKGRPLIISSLVIDEYSENHVDTLHKKNLLSLGEDRYLTTLILKHFPNFKTKFTPDAQALTSAPDSWSVLLSQRRRWVNSTVHNLFQLVFIDQLCGFCLFSMRFVVFVDLLGTLILPATFVYLIYLIVTVATGNGQIPVFSIVILAAVYGLQAIIFLLKRQWQFIGWLVIYIIAYPVYSFLLPLYSFWHFDDFSWGTTRVVVGEGRSKKVLTEEDPYDDSMIPMAKFSTYQNALWERTSDRSHGTMPFAPSQMGFKSGSMSGDLYRDSRPPVFHQSSASINPFGNPAAPVYAPSVYGSDRGMTPFMPPTMGQHSRGVSAYSLGSMIPPSFGAGANQTSDPSNAELTNAIKLYLSQQDLMMVTKRSTREALASMFPNADLTQRKDFVNATVDLYLKGEL